jgi:hypothetical protein
MLISCFRWACNLLVSPFFSFDFEITSLLLVLSELFDNYELDYIIIENQISTIATRMKSIQCMLSQFFIIKHPYSQIEFISSTNKLKFNEGSKQLLEF